MAYIGRFVWLGVLAAALPVHAGISVYNPATGENEVLTPSSALPETPVLVTAPKKPALPDVINLNPDEPEVIVDKALGEAIFFVDFAKYDRVLGEKLKQIEGINGLSTMFLTEAKDPKEYYMDIVRRPEAFVTEAMRQDKNFNADDFDEEAFPEFSADSRGKAFAYYRPGGWHRVVYVDPTGSKRIYGLDHDLDKFLRHLNRIRRGE